MARTIEAQNEYLGKASDVNVSNLGNGVKDNEFIDQVMSSGDAAFEAFMHEPVTVMVMESNDPNDVDLVQVSVNGRPQFFERNRPQVVKRYYVERLARAKRTSYTQNLDERLGESMNNMQSRHALRYPFSVVEDKNPKGGAWLRQILAERT